MIRISPDPASAPHGSSEPKPHSVDGRVVPLGEYLGHQAALAAKGFRDLLYPGHYAPVAESDIPLEESLLHVGHSTAVDADSPDYQRVQADARMQLLMHQWAVRFGPLFGLMTKKYQMPVEIVERKLEYYQARLIEHMQHLRDIWRQHSGNELSMGELWEKVEWLPYKLVSENNVTYLMQTVLFPYVVGEGADCKLVMDKGRLRQETMWCALDLFPPLPEETGPFLGTQENQQNLAS